MATVACVEQLLNLSIYTDYIMKESDKDKLYYIYIWITQIRYSITKGGNVQSEKLTNQWIRNESTQEKYSVTWNQDLLF